MRFRKLVAEISAAIKRHTKAGDGGLDHLEYPPIPGLIGHAHVAVVTMIDEEFQAVAEALKTSINVDGTGYYVKEINPEKVWDVAVIQSPDRTNFPTGMAVRDVLEDLRPQFVLLVGIAGGLCDGDKPRESIALGDVVIPDYVSYGEFLKFDGAKMHLRYFAIDHPSVHLRQCVSNPMRISFKLQEQVEIPRPADLGTGVGFKIHIAQILAMEKILGGENNEFQDRIIEVHDKAIALDTESMGIARGMCDGRRSFWYNPRYAIIRGISDLVGVEGNNETRASWKRYAAHAAAVVAREFIRKLPIERGVARHT